MNALLDMIEITDIPDIAVAGDIIGSPYAEQNTLWLKPDKARVRMEIQL